MPTASIDLVWALIIGTVVLVVLVWAVVATTVLFRRRNLAIEKEKLDALRKSEQKFADLFNNISDIAFVHSLDGRIEQINAAVTRELGYPVEEIEGRLLTDILLPKHLESLDDYLREVLEKRFYTGLVWVAARDGEVKVFECRNSLVVSGGKPVAVRGIARNVTEQRRVEKALRRSEERYRRFFEEDLTGDFIADPDGHIKSCNPAFARIFGFGSLEEALNCNLASLYPRQSDYQNFLKLVTEHRKLTYHETELRRRDGRPLFVIENIIGGFGEDDRLRQLRGYIFDNTERKHLEQQLLHAQKMQSIGTLAGGVAHDFNNILSIIMGHASLLQQGSVADKGDPDSLRAILQAVKRGAHLVRQILTFARKTDISFQIIRINQVVNELTEMINGTFPKTILLSLNLDEKIAPVRADQNQLHQALLNLCVNSRDAMPHGGTLSITTRMCPANAVRNRFPEAAEGDYVCLEIADTGTGMSSQTLERLFEPFFTTKVRGQGTGLGLAVVYGIVSSHGGFVDVKSAVGEGTRFLLYFPAVATADGENQERKEMPPEMASGGKETILLVEDEDLLVNLMTTVLTANGYSVLVARDGLSAVEIYQQHWQEIDLVFSDSGLPRMGGWEAFCRMKEINPGIHAVFASGYFDPDLKSRMIEKGVTDFIQKPYSPTSVLNQIRKALDRQ